MSKRCGGFSLIELMVALVIGLVIFLGAGQLFMTVFQTNRQVETLSEKQAAVNFATETLLRDIRRADWNGSESPWDEDDGILTLAVRNRGDISVSAGCGVGDDVVKKYQLKDRGVSGNTEWFMAVEIAKCKDKELGGGLQELVGGFISPDADTSVSGFVVDDNNWSDGILQVTFRLVPTDEDATLDTLTFFAVNRTAAVNDNLNP